jgi:hypothetical protein
MRPRLAWANSPADVRFEPRSPERGVHVFPSLETIAQIAPRPVEGRAAARSMVGLALITRIGIVVGLTAITYHYTLVTLWLGFGELGPFSYGLLVPPLALLIALVHGVERGFEPKIHDRSLDYLIGSVFLTAALAIVLILPLSLSVFFWQWRIDVLSLPLFIAGAVSIGFDLRALWRMRFALVFLILSWPPLYFLVAPKGASILAAANGAVMNSLMRRRCVRFQRRHLSTRFWSSSSSQSPLLYSRAASRWPGSDG